LNFFVIFVAFVVKMLFESGLSGLGIVGEMLETIVMVASKNKKEPEILSTH
jgi:hypothetical protein